MAIIYSYPINTNILATDIIVGSSTVLVGGRPKNQTKSFEIQDLAAYFASAILPPGSYVPYTGAVGSVNLGIHNLTAASIIKAGGTNLQYLMADGSISTGTFVPAAALTKTDDTNVTLTLGGSPATALLAATSLTLGWSGTLADSRITSAAIWNAKQDAITLTTLGTSGAATFIANTLNIPSYVDQFVGTVTSVGLTAPSAFTITGSPITTSGTLAITGAGLVSQYIDGTGALQTFPALSSGTVTNIATAGLISGGAITTTGTITTLMATNRLVGRGTALSGVMEEIILGTNLSLTGTTLNAVNSGGTVTSVTATTPVLSTGGTTPVISMPLGTSSVDGYLSAADRTNFETAYTNRITSLTTTGTGAATLAANVLNIPNYSSSLSGTINRVSKFNTTTSISDSTIEDNGSSVIINRPNGSTSGYKLDVNGPVFCDYGTSNVINVPSAININMPYYNLVGGTPDASIVNINGKGPLANGYMTGYNVQVSGPDNAGFFGDFSDTSAASIGIRLDSRPLHTGDFVNYNKYIGSTSTIVHKIDNAGNVTSASYIKTGGTNLQFLMADGSVSTAPSLTGFVPYTGAIQAVDLGPFNLTVNGISVGKGTAVGVGNVGVGYNPLQTIPTGDYNIAIGYQPLYFNTTGASNVAIGALALKDNTTGIANVAVGVNALAQNTIAGSSTACGDASLYANTTGLQNTAVGVRSLFNNITGNGNIGIGVDALLLNNSDNNSIVIGNSTTGLGSNTVTIGNVSVTTTRLRGAVQGGSFVKDTGTVYETLRADGSVTTDGTLYKVTSASYSIVSGSSFFFSAAIPSNIFADGDNLKINTITATTAIAVSVVIMRYYINTAPSIVGAIQIANWSGNLGSISYPMDRVYWVNGGNFYARNFTSSSPSSTNTGQTAINSTPIPLGSFYIIVEVITTAPDLAGLLNFQIIKS